MSIIYIEKFISNTENYNFSYVDLRITSTIYLTFHINLQN